MTVTAIILFVLVVWLFYRLGQTVDSMTEMIDLIDEQRKHIDELSKFTAEQSSLIKRMAAMRGVDISSESSISDAVVAEISDSSSPTGFRLITFTPPKRKPNVH
jgi:hypothetical protein